MTSGGESQFCGVAAGAVGERTHYLAPLANSVSFASCKLGATEQRLLASCKLGWVLGPFSLSAFSIGGKRLNGISLCVCVCACVLWACCLQKLGACSIMGEVEGLRTSRVLRGLLLQPQRVQQLCSMSPAVRLQWFRAVIHEACPLVTR